jgi:hypothetical protein
VVGYHLGGLPLLGRTFGYAADRVRALDVVTADGEPRTLTPDDDLFRAMLGCRGAFGVMTSLVTEALSLRSVTGGGLWFTATGSSPPSARTCGGRRTCRRPSTRRCCSSGCRTCR